MCINLRKRAKIRSRYNQVPHLTEDTNGKVTNSQSSRFSRLFYVGFCLIVLSLLSVIRLVFEIFMFGADFMVWCFVSFQLTGKPKAGCFAYFVLTCLCIFLV